MERPGCCWVLAQSGHLGFSACVNRSGRRWGFCVWRHLSVCLCAEAVWPACLGSHPVCATHWICDPSK